MGIPLHGGMPACNDTWFQPPRGFADGEQFLARGVAVPHAQGASAQPASCPACRAQLETGAAPGQAPAGQGAQDAGRSTTSSAAPSAAPSDSGAIELKQLVTMLSSAMVCLLQSLVNDGLKEEVLHRCVQLPSCVLHCICQHHAKIRESELPPGAQHICSPAVKGGAYTMSIRPLPNTVQGLHSPGAGWGLDAGQVAADQARRPAPLSEGGACAGRVHGVGQG